MLLLVIDDDAEDAELFQEAISFIDDSAICVAALSGKDGLNVLRFTIPDIVFLDINMPIMDGKETLARIRSNEAMNSVPVYIFSTSANGREFDFLKDAGAAGCISKPNSFQELCEVLRGILQQHDGNKVP
jgi:CheY-like chemotaxis protein